MMEIELCPEISVLSSLLDDELVGEENETVKFHVRNCPACAQRLEYMAAGHQVLVKSLGKSMTLGNHSKKKDCISAETMAAYFHDLLSVEEKTRVESHLDLCDACLSELTSLAKTEMQMRQSDMEPLPDSLRRRVETLWNEEESKKEQVPHLVTRLVREGIGLVRDLLPRPSLSFGGALAAVMAGLLLFIWWGSEEVNKESPRSPAPSSQVASVPRSTQPESKQSTEALSTPTTTSGPPVASRSEAEREKVSIPAGRQDPLTESKSGPHPGDPALPSGLRKTSQDFKDIRVEVSPLQMSGAEVIVLLKIFNKTSTNLGVVLSESAPILTDTKGVAYRPKALSGIKAGLYVGQNWTYIVPHGEHAISLNFDQRDLPVRRDSLYSISVEIVVAPRDSIERTKAGSKPAGAETLKIALQGIGTQ